MIGDDQPTQLPTIRSADQWSDARDAELSRLWAVGVSCAAIAVAVNKIGTSQDVITRHAIIGRARRLKLGTHPNVQNRRAAGEAERVRRVERAARPAVDKVNKANHSNIGKWTHSSKPVEVEPLDASLVIKDDAEIPAGQRSTVFESGIGKCRWPVGDPLNKDFFWCGGDVVPGKSYCVGHYRRSHR